MKWKNVKNVALRSIVRNRMRSLLTSLGIVIGVCSVIVMVAVGQGSQRKITKDIASLGTNLLIVIPGSGQHFGVSRGAASENRLTLDDVDRLDREALYIEAVSALVRTNAQVIGGGNNWSTVIEGVSVDYLKVKDWELQQGEFFDDKAIRTKKKVAVLGMTVADELYPEQNPVGEKIRIQNTPFTVIGVLTEKGQNTFGSDNDDVALAPATTVLNRLKGGQYINAIFVSAISTEHMDVAANEITSILRDEHGLTELEEDDFSIRKQTEIMQMASSMLGTLTLLLGAIAAVSLLVGGIGIMNIMLVSVTERTREIGIRLSVGARGSDILTQFLVEAVVLSLAGGVLGVFLAFTITFALGQVTTLSPIISFSTIMMAFLFAAIVGIFFGFYPARKAANLNPIDALRYE